MRKEVKYRFSSISSYKESIGNKMLPILKSAKVVLMEKLDGSNVQIERVGNQLLVGSREFYLSEELSLSGAYEYVQNLDVNKFKEGFIYFGEWLSGHKVDYGTANNTIVIFAITKNTKETDYLEFLPYKETVEMIKETGLKQAPVLFEGVFTDFDTIKSYIGQTKLAKTFGEGFVMYVYDENDEPIVRKDGKPNIVKFVSPKYKEYKNKSNVPPMESELLIDFVERTVVNARLEKILFKNQEIGDLPRPITENDKVVVLQTLNKQVWEDVISEEGLEFDDLYNKECERLYAENVDTALLLTEEKTQKLVYKKVKQKVNELVLNFYLAKLEEK